MANVDASAFPESFRALVNSGEVSVEEATGTIGGGSNPTGNDIPFTYLKVSPEWTIEQALAYHGGKAADLLAKLAEKVNQDRAQNARAAAYNAAIPEEDKIAASIARKLVAKGKAADFDSAFRRAKAMLLAE